MNKFEKELQEHLNFFESASMPDVPFKLNNYLNVTGIDRFIAKEAHVIRDHKGSEKVHESLMEHLREFKEIILNQ